MPRIDKVISTFHYCWLRSAPHTKDWQRSSSPDFVWDLDCWLTQLWIRHDPPLLNVVVLTGSASSALQNLKQVDNVLAWTTVILLEEWVWAQILIGGLAGEIVLSVDSAGWMLLFVSILIIHLADITVFFRSKCQKSVPIIDGQGIILRSWSP